MMINAMKGQLIMRVQRDTAKLLRIPTEGMDHFETSESPCYKRTDSGEFDSTKFWKDKGQMDWYGDPADLRIWGYFVQRLDGVIALAWDGSGREGVRSLLAPCVDEHINAEVIECRIPELLLWLYDDDQFGSEAMIQNFIAMRHPNTLIRDGLRLHLGTERKRVDRLPNGYTLAQEYPRLAH